MESLSENQKSILRFILEHAFEADEQAVKKAFPQLFLDLEMDQINNLAMEALGDIILAREGRQWILYDEYRAELEGALR
jgi:hypothetical protein